MRIQDAESRRHIHKHHSDSNDNSFKLNRPIIQLITKGFTYIYVKILDKSHMFPKTSRIMKWLTMFPLSKCTFTQCGNSRIFLPHRFYVKSISSNFEFGTIQSSKNCKNFYTLNIQSLWKRKMAVKLISRKIWEGEKSWISTLCIPN